MGNMRSLHQIWILMKNRILCAKNRNFGKNISVLLSLGGCQGAEQK